MYNILIYFTNIFSKKFVVETSCKETKKYFKQTWTDNMNKAQDPVIKPNKDEDFTQITFYPDLKKFGMDNLEDDTIALLARRAYDIAASTRGVKVYLNDKRLPISKFEDYCKLYVVNNTGDEMSDSSTTKIIYESNNPRWEIAVRLDFILIFKLNKNRFINNFYIVILILVFNK